MSDMETNIEKRRSIYALGKKEILPHDEVMKIVNHSVKYCPSAFNSQSARTVVLFGKHHDRLWDIVLEVLKPLTPPDKFKKTEEKVLSSFKAGYGTILYYEDDAVIKELQYRFPLYKDNFPKWSLQSNGMLEFTIWTALAEKNIGATLQHYSPLIDAACQKEWNIPETWKLLAQMPFGSIEAPADPKDFMPLEERVKVFG